MRCLVNTLALLLLLLHLQFNANVSQSATLNWMKWIKTKHQNGIGQNKKLQPNRTCDIVSGCSPTGETCKDVSALGDSATATAAGEEIADSRRGKQLACWYIWGNNTKSTSEPVKARTRKKARQYDYFITLTTIPSKEESITAGMDDDDTWNSKRLFRTENQRWNTQHFRSHK